MYSLFTYHIYTKSKYQPSNTDIEAFKNYIETAIFIDNNRFFRILNFLALQYSCELENLNSRISTLTGKLNKFINEEFDYKTINTLTNDISKLTYLKNLYILYQLSLVDNKFYTKLTVDFRGRMYHNGLFNVTKLKELRYCLYFSNTNCDKIEQIMIKNVNSTLIYNQVSDLIINQFPNLILSRQIEIM